MGENKIGGDTINEIGGDNVADNPDPKSAAAGATRREFIARAGGLLGAAGLPALAGCATGRGGARGEGSPVAIVELTQAASTAPRGAGDKIRMGFIGVGGRGRNMLERFSERPDVEVAALCDVNQASLAEALKMSPGRPTTGDHHELLARPDIDAVVIATPDHWHAIITIDACRAGKDVYVEKPLSLCVAEGRRMIEAARKHGRIVQLGTQQVSGEHYIEARDRIHNDELGHVTMVRVWNFRNAMPGRGRPADSAPPPGLDWNRWLGPRPVVPYNPLKAGGGFRMFWEYAGGILTDWGVHHMHTVMEIMKYDTPTAISGAGGRFAVDDITTVPDTLSVLYQFPTWVMEFSSRETNGQAPYGSEYGIELLGTKAAMFLDRKGYAIYPEKDRTRPIIVGKPGVDNFLPEPLDKAHVENFIRCVRSRQAPASEVAKGHHATSVAHLGNIAFRVGRQIKWDSKTESIPGDAEADALLRRDYRAPFTLPEA